jgi:small subunit ribosomal protein S1
VVKNITDYGAFVDLGGIDGLLHVTDMSWKRVNHPSQVLAVGDTVKVQIVKINPDTQRISLGMKQLQSDPWDGVEAKYPVGAKFTGRITNITDYGAFVELEAGRRGPGARLRECPGPKKNVHPGKIVSTSQEVDVVVPGRRSVQAPRVAGPQAGPGQSVGGLPGRPPDRLDRGEGEVKNATEFGLFIGLSNDIDGMVHLSDLDWAAPGEKPSPSTQGRDRQGPRARTSTSRRTHLARHQAALGRPDAGRRLPQGPDRHRDRHRDHLGRHRGEVRRGRRADDGLHPQVGPVPRPRRPAPERFAVGDRLDAQVTNVDKAARRISLSVKALEMAEERKPSSSSARRTPAPRWATSWAPRFARRRPQE